MSKMYLPTITASWKNYIENAEKVYQDLQEQITKKLDTAITEALDSFSRDCHLDDKWLRNLDWTITEPRIVPEKVSKKGVVTPARQYKSNNPALIGKPKWLRDLWDSKLKTFRLTSAMKSVPYLLKMQWKGYPLCFTDTHGWLFKVPKTADLATETMTPILFTESNAPIAYDRLFDYFKLPHPGGVGKNCGNPLSKLFLKAAQSGIMTSDSSLAKDILSLSSKCSYWISARKRMMSQFVVSNSHGIMEMEDGNQGVGVIIPQCIPMGTVTRRSVDATWVTAANARMNDIGSEVKSRITSPKGYKFVGADVDSQELWISSLMGDRQFMIQGATAFGFMTLQGTKSNGTDLHSTSGKLANISRDQAKIFNYSRIYGAGQRYASQVLVQNNPDMDPVEAKKKVAELYKKTKGLRFDNKKMSPFWYGGSESFMFNELERIATAEESRTPVLGCLIPDSLSTKYVQNDVKVI